MSEKPDQPTSRSTPSVPVAPLRALIAQWEERAWVSNEEGRRINRTVKAVTYAETRCYARAEVYVKCAKEMKALLDGLPGGQQTEDAQEQEQVTRVDTMGDGNDSPTAMGKRS